MRKPRFENGVKKGLWSAEEDQRLSATVNCVLKRFARIGNWTEIPKYAGLFRNGKSCRLRWVNYLSPIVKRGNFTQEEEAIIISLHEKMGNKWSAIASELKGRTDNEVKNHWHRHLKKRVEKEKDTNYTKKKNIAPLIIPSNSESGSCTTSESINLSNTTTSTAGVEVNSTIGDDFESFCQGLPFLVELKDHYKMVVPHDEPLIKSMHFNHACVRTF